MPYTWGVRAVCDVCGVAVFTETERFSSARLTCSTDPSERRPESWGVVWKRNFQSVMYPLEAKALCPWCLDKIGFQTQGEECK
jgi:hypothetical protein